MRFWLVAAVLGLGILAGTPPAHAISFTGLYSAQNASGDQAPPTYILRLDGVFPGTGPVTFNEQGVSFEIFADGSASLLGTVAVGEPGSPSPFFGSTWDLNAQWDPAGMSSSEQFFTLSAGTLTRQVGPTDLVEQIFLSPRGMDAHAGTGIFPDRKCVSTEGEDPCFAFAAWVEYEYRVDGVLISAWDGQTADFIMELAAAPEPNAALLVAVAAIGGWLRQRRVRRSRSPIV